MALATQEDVEAALGRDLTAAELERVEGLLDGASDLVIGYLHPCKLPDPTPGAVVRVVADVVIAALKQIEITADMPEQVTSAGAGIFSVGFGSGGLSSNPWLNQSMRDRLAPYACSGMVSIGLTSERRN